MAIPMRRLIGIPLLIAFLLFLTCGCRDNKAQHNSQNNSSLVSYAQYFQIIGGTPYDTLVSINNWESSADNIEKYPLIPRDNEEELKKNIYAIPIPIESSVSMSTSYLSHLKLLNSASCVKAMSGVAFVYDSLYIQMINNDKIVDIGSDASPDYEKIISLNSDVVLAYGIGGSDNSYIKKLRSLGQRVVIINDYLEGHPIAKLEYLKFFGALRGMLPKSDSIFSERANEYFNTRELLASKIDSTQTTKVLINLPFKDIWYVPGSENYTSLMVKDAGGEILGCREGSTISSQESFEKMFSLGMSADVWINLNNFSTLQSIEIENPMYAKFPMFRNGMLFNNNKRSTAIGGSDFWETGAVEPAEILKDLITIFHPQIAKEEFGDRELKYYQQLK